MNVKNQYSPGYDPYSSRNSLGADPEYTFGTASRTYDPEYDYGGRPTAAQREADLLALEKARLKRISDAQFTIPNHAAASVFTGSYPSKEPTGYGISGKEYNPQNLVTPVTNILPENNNQGAPWKTQTTPTQWSNVQRSGQQKNQLPQPEFVQRILGEEPFPGFYDDQPQQEAVTPFTSLKQLSYTPSVTPQQIIDIGDEELFPGFHSEEELPLIRTSYGQSKKVGSDPFLTGFGAEKEWDKSSELFASQVQNIMKGYNDPVADYTKVAGKGIITNPNSDYFQEHLDELIPAEENVNIGIAKKELNKILDTQYPIAMDFPEAQYLAGSADVTAAIANNRLNQAVETIIDHKLSIYRYANEFNIPPEIIGSIILKEQYTRSIPDWLGNITTPIGKILPDSLMKNKYIGKAFGSHSTGLGAVFASTARDAWNFCVGKKEANRILPEDNYALQVKLAQDPDFNIKTICAVLKHKAAQIGEDLDHATKDRWISILTAYNGGSEYGPKTIEYVPYVKSILENSVW